MWTKHGSGIVVEVRVMNSVRFHEWHMGWEGLKEEGDDTMCTM